jgi:hypothetical protein
MELKASKISINMSIVSCYHKSFRPGTGINLTWTGSDISHLKSPVLCNTHTNTNVFFLSPMKRFAPGPPKKKYICLSDCTWGYTLRQLNYYVLNVF